MKRSKSKAEQPLKTKNLILRPQGDEELAAELAAEGDGEMRKALGDMLAGCRSDAEHRLWWTNWVIEQRSDATRVGSLCLKGPAVQHETEIGYGIDETQQGRGYATEAAKALIGWAFDQDPELYFMTAETEADNAASQRVLEKLGFVSDGIVGEEGPRFVLERPASAWMSIYMCLGMSMGLCFGTATDNLAIGLCLGLAIGMALGVSLDSQARKKIEAAREARQKARE